MCSVLAPLAGYAVVTWGCVGGYCILPKEVAMHDEETLITDYIELNPDKPGLDQARNKEYVVAV